jgi:hypothetical protein
MSGPKNHANEPAYNNFNKQKPKPAHVISGEPVHKNRLRAKKPKPRAPRA